MQCAQVISIETVARTARSRLVPCLFGLYVIAYLDRINVGFASLTMNRDLSLSSQQFGLLSGIFFWGYFLFELPSNLILHRVGARRWIPRLLLTWGLVSLTTGFVNNAWQLYGVRFLLGVAEAGFFPGILLYLSYWFRQKELALTIGLFMTAIPVASVVGAPLSGWILDHVHPFGTSSWRWVFFLEAVPAIVAGCLAYRWLPNGPADAWFLKPDERSLLSSAIRQESLAHDSGVSVGHTLRDGRVLHLCLVSFLFLAGMYTASFWMPQSIQSSARALSHSAVGWLTVVPHALGLLAMILVSKNSNLRRERHAHAGVSLMVAAVGFTWLSSVQTLSLCIAGWSLVTCGLYGFLGPFLAIPSQFLSGRALAAALATINSVGNLGGFVGVSAIGLLATQSHSAFGGYRWVALSVACAGALLLLAKQHRFSGRFEEPVCHSA